MLLYFNLNTEARLYIVVFLVVLANILFIYYFHDPTVWSRCHVNRARDAL